MIGKNSLALLLTTFSKTFGISLCVGSIAIGQALFVGQPAHGGPINVDFEDISLGDADYLDGSYTGSSFDDDPSQGGGSGYSRASSFVSRGASFVNWYDRGWFVWTGFAITRLNAPVPSDPVYVNQYSAAAGPAFEGTNYAIAYLSSYGLAPVIDLPFGYDAASVRITNTTYAKAVIKDGFGSYARKFGDDPTTNSVVETDHPDFFGVTFTGYAGANASGSVVGHVDFFLADYRFAENSLDFIVDDWASVSLASLAGSRSIALSWFSTDTSMHSGSTYINTPTYVALDNLSLVAVPEPSSIVLLAGGAVVAVAARWRFRRRGSLTRAGAPPTRAPRS